MVILPFHTSDERRTCVQFLAMMDQEGLRFEAKLEEDSFKIEFK
jgi:hypothetical protein